MSIQSFWNSVISIAPLPICWKMLTRQRVGLALTMWGWLRLTKLECEMCARTPVTQVNFPRLLAFPRVFYADCLLYFSSFEDFACSCSVLFFQWPHPASPSTLPRKPFFALSEQSYHSWIRHAPRERGESGGVLSLLVAFTCVPTASITFSPPIRWGWSYLERQT